MKKLKKFLSLTLCTAALLSVTAPYASAADGSFTDVPAGAWFYDAVTACVEKGIVSGMGDNKYMPDNDLTYAQFVTMLVNAFYKGEEDAYCKANVTGIDRYYDNSTPWWGRYAYFFSAEGLFKDTNGNAKSFGVMNSNVNRYEMAQLVANILSDKSFTVPESDKAAAQNKIKDWSDIPAQYRDAVSTAFSLGILSGFEDGSFGGTGVLTRAQACVVMVKLDDTLRNGPGTPGTPVEPEPPQPPAATGEIKVSESNGAFTVTDNGFSTGTLNNGLPITEDNVIALLAKAQKIWPGAPGWNFTDRGATNNHWYETYGDVIRNILSGKANANYGCGGFAAMVSDYLFGKNNNPAHRVTDPMDIRAGDIIIQLVNGKAIHVSLAATSVIKDGGDYNGRLWTADGNDDHTGIAWPDYEYGGPTSEYVNSYITPGLTWEVWSRYPD